MPVGDAGPSFVNFKRFCFDFESVLNAYTDMSLSVDSSCKLLHPVLFTFQLKFRFTFCNHIRITAHTLEKGSCAGHMYRVGTVALRRTRPVV